MMPNYYWEAIFKETTLKLRKINRTQDIVLVRTLYRVLGIWTSVTWQWLFCFRLEPILGNDQAASKIVVYFKSGQIEANQN